MKKILIILLDGVQEAINQVLGIYPQPKLHITKFAENQMLEWGISQSDVEDVFYRGIEYRKDKSKRFKTYGSYQIWIKVQIRKGIPTITSVWKWEPKK